MAARFVEIETEAADQFWGGKLDQKIPELEFARVAQTGPSTGTRAAPGDYTCGKPELDARCDTDLACRQEVELGHGQSHPASPKVVHKDTRPLCGSGNSNPLFSRPDTNFGIPEFLRVVGAISLNWEPSGRWVTFFRRVNVSDDEWESWDEFVRFD